MNLMPEQQAGRAIRFSGASKWFTLPDRARLDAVKAVDLEIPAHQFVAIVGPSGCGKSTLLRLADGLVVPDAGMVTVGDAPPAPGPAIGVVFQNFRLIPWRNALDNVAFALEARSLPAGQCRALALEQLRLVGLDAWADRYPAQMSGGMRQRVALARALVGRPDILLMDEPFASLDAQTRELMQEDLARLYEARRPSVLFVTHSVDEALLLADRIIVMGGGRVIEDLPVALPRSRSMESVSGNAHFLALRAHLWEQIRRLVLADPNSAFFGRDQ